MEQERRLREEAEARAAEDHRRAEENIQRAEENMQVMFLHIQGLGSRVGHEPPPPIFFPPPQQLAGTPVSFSTLIPNVDVNMHI